MCDWLASLQLSAFSAAILYTFKNTDYDFQGSVQQFSEQRDFVTFSVSFKYKTKVKPSDLRAIKSDIQRLVALSEIMHRYRLLVVSLLHDDAKEFSRVQCLFAPA